jgi:hypothetical protein
MGDVENGLDDAGASVGIGVLTVLAWVGIVWYIILWGILLLGLRSVYVLSLAYILMKFTNLSQPKTLLYPTSFPAFITPTPRRSSECTWRIHPKASERARSQFVRKSRVNFLAGVSSRKVRDTLLRRRRQ